MLLTCSLCKDYFSLYPLVSRSIVVTGKNIQLWNIHLCFHPWTTVRDNHNLCRSWVVLLLKLVAMLSKGRLSQISQCCFMQRLSGTTLFTSLYWPWLFLNTEINVWYVDKHISYLPAYHTKMREHPDSCHSSPGPPTTVVWCLTTTRTITVTIRICCRETPSSWARWPAWWTPCCPPSPSGCPNPRCLWILGEQLWN